MKSFIYVITDAVGIHARPAGMLVKEVKKYDSKITLTKAGKKVEAGKLMAIMTLGVKCGDEVVVEIEGGDEETAFQGMQKFFEETLQVRYDRMEAVMKKYNGKSIFKGIAIGDILFYQKEKQQVKRQRVEDVAKEKER